MSQILPSPTMELEREVARIRVERLAGNFDTADAVRLADLCAAIRDRRRHPGGISGGASCGVGIR